MNILALDTATTGCSVAWLSAGQLVAGEEAVMARGHAEALAPMIERVVAASGRALSALDRLAVTIGPGHFTGLRVGLATARGLALALARPLVGITTLDAIAADALAAARLSEDERLVVAIDSKRADAYVQIFDGQGVALDSPQALRPEEAAGQPALAGGSRLKVWLAGDGAPAVGAALRRRGIEVEAIAGVLRPRAIMVAKLAAAASLPDRAPLPFYLHPVEARPAAPARTTAPG